MIELYKIGLSNLPNKDSNSAKFEYELISNTLKKLNLNDTLVLIGGKFDYSEFDTIQELMKAYKFKVFIATDTISISSCKDLINCCDLLLHQCPKSNIDGISIKQRYSYVPELFYTDFEPIEQDDLLFFAGGYRDVRNIIEDYTTSVPSKLMMKTKDNDNRLPYSQYLKELSKHKYGLVLLRRENHIPGWITSRFIEYISCNVFPIVHFEYDEYDYFNAFKCINGNDAGKLIRLLNDNECLRVNLISVYKAKFLQDKYKLLDVLQEEYYEQIAKS